MFISVLELFKIGIGPSSSHTMGPMVAAHNFIELSKKHLSTHSMHNLSIRCILKGSLSLTGKGHATDRAIALGLHGYLPEKIANKNLDKIIKKIWDSKSVAIDERHHAQFIPTENIVFDQGKALPEHSNGMIFELLDQSGATLVTETYFSTGGGFISTYADINSDEKNKPVESQKKHITDTYLYGFDSSELMLSMTHSSQLSIAQMKRENELQHLSEEILNNGLDSIWQAMQTCIENGLTNDGCLPGGLNLPRRAKDLYQQLKNKPAAANINDWLCAYAMAVNEENAAGHMVVTAPTNGAAGVIPATLYYFVKHEGGTIEQVREFLLTASAIAGLIKHRSSISGAEVGCQGEVGSAAAMAAAGLCAVHGGTPQQIENAAEIALEHHLGMTCDPVNGLVQVPCIERNSFGAIKACTAASLALRGNGEHLVSLDDCIATMKQTGAEMSVKFKETSLGGLAVNINIIEC